MQPLLGIAHAYHHGYHHTAHYTISLPFFICIVFSFFGFRNFVQVWGVGGEMILVVDGVTCGGTIKQHRHTLGLVSTEVSR